ncbi:MAG: hypothetical protein NZ480_08800 [Bdellovibrionaceae bacterium]|nr:hypothetical protein [Pseudobdellovibrionaceae bacterium]
MIRVTIFYLFFSVGFALNWGYISEGRAWGLRGHGLICEAATHLVESNELREFLVARIPMIIHLCNVPDIYWKSLPNDIRKIGDPTHFIDPEILGLPISKIDTNWKKLKKRFEGKPNRFRPEQTITNLESELGSLWWRTEQFFRLGSYEWQKATNFPPPQNRKEEQDEQLPFNQGVYKGLVFLGVMGHFVGDASQPFHVTADYDGYRAGHGGIHSYYEDDLVAHLPADWITQIIEEAKKIRTQLVEEKKNNFLKEKDILKSMRLFSEVGYQDIPEIYKLDPVISPSMEKIEKDEKGNKQKVPAIRAPARDSVTTFAPLLRVQMARGALYLAHLWERAFKQSQKGKQSLALLKYKSYRYPFQPEFVAPDY